MYEKKSVLVSSIMTTEVVTIGLDDSLETIRKIFENSKFHHLLVHEKGKLVGVISDRDLLKRLCPWLGKISEKPHGRNTLEVKAHSIMSHNPITIFKDDSVEKTARLMLSHNVSCLPIISKVGGIEGIVTWKDILSFILKTDN
ncbi:MAG: CBS domain-containing protein [Candidatus Scalindua sp.]|jgi:acetoin utilization protein AcuB|nr:CBS domain-containing protein [Candidatus Scalindua sp.]MBT5303473.1 CBS domain-containing protein [Candidatus Scalindua sp.]MBT6050365.1 CBS domain-containing protein [Candidatus Scalindua sp.]MBT6225243.1 CBS domain-containing protein [Candidatus Scalindua sp.]MBT6564706.1 CBS domain-containing protein [Candidatus Scalindua sp.]